MDIESDSFLYYLLTVNTRLTGNFYNDLVVVVVERVETIKTPRCPASALPSFLPSLAGSRYARLGDHGLYNPERLVKNFNDHDPSNI